ncbi:uncharacterized protein PHACADRAFT_206284 [Phanerochaete carnosa HHB-10118-sp]|uniref:Nephrocystin 3-like N-terminal domain-containing protein n=1 Tax=Phanerochaete carnosa (strain HHB-10118-sp) TaxID=650164 RepID=K5XAW5_PHACS|nr:uncharacterized protein PHACADRAFT_206284 [Phanerochaete carnosa HHB-10118-sp]EKM60082.1 hypothetical protein PHACADRAFT_206284 [Phanerochaete carnosa HHB-10118-sp]
MRRLKEKLQSSKAPDAAIGHLKRALDVFNDVAGNVGVPGLQIGVSVLSTVLAMVQKSHANTESIKELATRVGDLTKMVQESAEMQGENISAPTQDRINGLLESWKIIDGEAQSLNSRHKFWRTLGSDKEAEEITGLVQRISSSIEAFTVGSMIAIESALHHHAHISKQDSQRVEAKIDVIPDIIVKRLLARWEGSFVPPHAARAQFDSDSERKACLDGTRTEILENIFIWAAGRYVPGGAAGPAKGSTLQQRNILWLNGLPGTGKTTLSFSVAKECHRRGILGASFFCSRSDADCSKPSMIFTTIAYRLGLFYEPYKDRVTEILKNDPDLVDSQVSRQFEELIVQPLALLREGFSPCVVVIDALDECQQPQITSTILSTLLEHADHLSPLRFFVTSRPERDIVATFDTPNYRDAFGKLLLHAVALQPVTTADIKRYLTVSLSDIRRYFGLADTWPNDTDIETLSKMAGGLFIFAATAIKFIKDRHYNDPIGQLKRLISAASSRGSHALLDELYLQVLKTATANMSASLSKRLQTILGSIATIKDPLPLSGLSQLLGLSTDIVYSSLVGLHSVLVIPDTQDSAENIRIIHPTFPEFLLDPSRCTNRSFTIDPQRQNTLLLRRCLYALRELKRDICDIRDPSLLNTEVPDLPRRIEGAIPAHLQYASRHWCTHLSSCEISDNILDGLLKLVQRRLPHWLEACSLLGVLRDVVPGINEAQRILRDIDDDRARGIIVLLNDCERLLVGHFPAISGSALQLYYSVLPIIPTKTMFTWTYAHERFAGSSIKVFGSIPDAWNACLGTVNAHGGRSVEAVDFSPNGRTIVSSGCDSKIRLWDALTCALLLVLSGHSKWVRSVKYSSDGTRIASAAEDGTVKVWDAVSGVLIRTLEGHVYGVLCAVFTPDGRRIVSGSDDRSVKIWDMQTGACLATLTVHNDNVRSVAVSRDGRWMASSSANQVYLWNLEASTCTHHVSITPESEGFTFRDIAFTPDNSQVVVVLASSNLAKLSVWDVKTAKHLRDLQPSGRSFSRIGRLSFLPTGNKLTCGAGKTILVLDFADGEVRHEFFGHTPGRNINSVTYNQDGTRIASGSSDGTIRLWDVSRSAAIKSQPEYVSKPSNLPSEKLADYRLAVFSHDASRALLVADDSYRSSSIEVVKTDSWDRVYKPLSLPSGRSHYAGFSPEGATILTASKGDRVKVILWDAASGLPRLQLEDELSAALWSCSSVGTFMWSGVLGYMPHCFGGYSSSAMFSQDSCYLLTKTLPKDWNSGGYPACLWNATTGKLTREFDGHSRDVTSVAFSLDGRRIATSSYDWTVIVWDATTGASLATCRGHKKWVTSAAFSPSGERVASGDSCGRILVWNTEGGEQLQAFEWYIDEVWSVAFTPAEDVIISFSGDNTMRFWCIESGACLLVLHPDTWYRTLHLSPDGSGILLDNDKRLVQLWVPTNADTQTTAPLPWLPRRTWPIYYIEDGWIFSLAPSRRTRLCWIPLDWRGLVGYLGHDVVLQSGHKLNFSRLSRRLESLHSDRAQ